MSGFHPRKVITTGQGRLLDCLWTRKGATTSETADILGIKRDLVFMWRSRGSVPLSSAGHVARKLKVSIYALNYEEVSILLGKSPKWESVVKSCKLKPEQIKYILEGTPPITFKQLVQNEAV